MLIRKYSTKFWGVSGGEELGSLIGVVPPEEPDSSFELCQDLLKIRGELFDIVCCGVPGTHQAATPPLR